MPESMTLRDAADVLQKCVGYAPDKTPAPNALTIQAWHDHFNEVRVIREEALWAVTQFFKKPVDRMVQPADISLVARAARRDFMDRNSTVEGEERKLAWAAYLRKLGGGTAGTELTHA